IVSGLPARPELGGQVGGVIRLELVGATVDDPGDPVDRSVGGNADGAVEIADRVSGRAGRSGNGGVRDGISLAVAAVAGEVVEVPVEERRGVQRAVDGAADFLDDVIGGGIEASHAPGCNAVAVEQIELAFLAGTD